MKTLTTCRDDVQADILKGRLESEGISCQIVHRGALPEIYSPSSFLEQYTTQILVPEEQYHAARAILHMSIDDDSVKCPKCNSVHVAEIEKIHNSSMKKLYHRIFHCYDRYFVCQKCGNKFYVTQ